MKVTGILALIFISTLQVSLAQKPKVFKAPLAGTVVLSQVDDKYNVSVYSMEAPDVDGAADMDKLKEVKAEVAAKFPHKQIVTAGRSTAVAPSPLIGLNFISDTLSGVPPDNYMAINDSFKAVSVMNQTIAVHNANTGAYMYRIGLSTFSRSVGLTNYMTDYRYDPKVMYDPEADRFICVMLSGTNQYNNIVMGFSQSNDPTGTWNFYKFYGDYTGDTTWFDYPAISMTHNEFFLTGNKIKYSTSWQAGFTRSIIYQVRKQDGYSGNATLTYQIWDSVAFNGAKIRCLHPVKPSDHLENPSQYFLSVTDFAVSNDTVYMIKVPDTIGSASNTLTVTPILSSLPYGVPPDGRQPDTAHTLATNDNRVLGAYMRGDEIQFVCTSVAPASGSSAIYHGIISTITGTPSCTGHIITVDTLDFGYPNISFADNRLGLNQSMITFNYSGPHTYPSFGGVFFDGTNYSNLVTIKSGDSSISVLTGKEQRWGDYSGSQPQWGAPGIVWVEGIYGRTNKQYGNYMAQLISPYFDAVTPLTKQPSLSHLYPNPAWKYVSFEFSVPQTESVEFIITDEMGRTVDKLPAQFCNEGKNMLQFNVAPLAPGVYFLKGVGSAGDVIAPKTFIKK